MLLGRGSTGGAGGGGGGVSDRGIRGGGGGGFRLPRLSSSEASSPFSDGLDAGDWTRVTVTVHTTPGSRQLNSSLMCLRSLILIDPNCCWFTPHRGAETVRTQSPSSRPAASASPPGATLLTTTVDIVDGSRPSPKDSPGCERMSLALTCKGGNSAPPSGEAGRVHTG